LFLTPNLSCDAPPAGSSVEDEALPQQTWAQLQLAVEAASPPVPAGHQGWFAYFDGSARPHVRQSGVGAVLIAPGAREVFELTRNVGFASSVIAVEFAALITALEGAVRFGARELHVFGDSASVVHHVLGRCRKTPERYLPFLAQALDLMAQIPICTVHWIPRHLNGQADALAKVSGSTCRQAA
jgi:ribonuclease HI